MSRERRWCTGAIVALTLASSISGCGSSPSAAPRTPMASSAVRWLCRPDQKGDPCKRADLSATEVGPHVRITVKGHHPALEPKADCFYVPASAKDDPLETTIVDAGRFTETCALWVPLYREEQAANDVGLAFADYLRSAPPNRKVVLIGHARGADLVLGLLRNSFDPDPAMQKRLLVALAIGGTMEVPPGKDVGGTLAKVPVCGEVDQIGCVVAFRAYVNGPLVDPGPALPAKDRETVCVNPTTLDLVQTPSSIGRISRSYFTVRKPVVPLDSLFPQIDTHFVEVNGFFGAECVEHPAGFYYLGVFPLPGDVLEHGPVDLDAEALHRQHGLRDLEMQIVQGSLIDLVDRRVKNLP